MTIYTTNSRIDYAGSATTVYPYTFRIFAATDLNVYAGGILLTYPVDYTVSGVGDAGGGDVTFTTAPDGLAVAIIRNVPPTQGTDFVENDSLPAESLESGLDRTTVLCQQVIEEAGRALQFPITSTTKNVYIAELVASKLLVVNSTADGISMGDVGDASSIIVPVTPDNGGTGQTSLSAARDALLSSEDSRTATVAVGATVKVTTSGSPAAGIGTGIKYQAQSADETPSDFGATQFVASDVGSGTEDTYFEILIRRAGAALATAYRYAATGTFKAIFTHANSADRTYTLPNASDTLVGKATTDTLTNKTLTSPAINGGTIDSALLNSASIDTPTILDPIIIGGITNNSAIKHQQFGATTATAASVAATADTIYTWGAPFADANYIPIATPFSSSSGVPILTILTWDAATVTIRVTAATAVAAVFSGISMIAIHD